MHIARQCTYEDPSRILRKLVTYCPLLVVSYAEWKEKAKEMKKNPYAKWQAPPSSSSAAAAAAKEEEVEAPSLYESVSRRSGWDIRTTVALCVGLLR